MDWTGTCLVYFENAPPGGRGGVCDSPPCHFALLRMLPNSTQPLNTPLQRTSSANAVLALQNFPGKERSRIRGQQQEKKGQEGLKWRGVTSLSFLVLPLLPLFGTISSSFLFQKFLFRTLSPFPLAGYDAALYLHRGKSILGNHLAPFSRSLHVIRVPALFRQLPFIVVLSLPLPLMVQIGRVTLIP